MYFAEHKTEIQLLLSDPSSLLSTFQEIKKYNIQHVFWGFLGVLYKNKCYQPLHIEYFPGSYEKSPILNENFILHKKKEDNEKLEELIHFYMFNPLMNINHKEKIEFFWDKDCDNAKLYQKNMEMNNLIINQGEIFFLDNEIKNIQSYEEYLANEHPMLVKSILQKTLDNVLADCFILQVETILNKEHSKNYQMVFNNYNEGVHFNNKKLTKKYQKELNVVNEYLTYFASYADKENLFHDKIHYCGKTIKKLIKKTNGLSYTGIMERLNGIDSLTSHESYLLSVSREIEKESLSKLILNNNDKMSKPILRI